MDHLKTQVRTQARSLRGRLATMRPAERRVVLGALVACGLVLVATLATAVYFWRLSVQFPEAPFRQPSRLYGAATRLAVGTAYDPDDLAAELDDQGYREAAAPGPLARGTFRRTDGEGTGATTIAVHLRRFPTPQGAQEGGPLEVRLQNGKVAALRANGRAVGQVELPPPLLASYYSPDINERRPVRLDDLPEEVVRAVLAAEDDAFFIHPGVSVASITRAAWKNLRGGEVQQGGSTITQQLVKNLYLTNERTLKRKVREAVTAVLLEMRHGKRAILEAYLNEIYWGRSGPANLIGLGAAASAYFGKDAAELTLGEAATLAGMIRAPSDYSPVDHPAAARERRDYVLRRLAELEWIEAARVEAALAQPLRTDPRPVMARRMAPYFSHRAADEARERFDLDELADEGYLLFSTLTWRDQRRAEEAVEAGLARLEAGPERRKKADGPLQAALVSVDPRDGSILAYVGGRDYAESQFDRISQARRQAGSAFKPVVYATAFDEGIASPATTLRDSPIVVRQAGQRWRPQNNDRSFHGTVTVRAALARSLNVPTVRIALQSGLHQVVAKAREMGIEGRLEPLPALALGAFGASPRELAQVYATLASGGLKPPVHGLRTVLDREGEPVHDDALPRLTRVLDAQAAYLVTSILEGVVRDTAGPRGTLAGKTGTTSGRRDSWFAGYSSDRVTVVWVGYDDNSRTRLSGASAALPLWTRFMRSVRPAGGWPELAPPPGITTVQIDPTTGMLATELCPQAVAEVFPEWEAPTQPCTRHGMHWGEPWMEAGGTVGPDGFDPRYPSSYYGDPSYDGYGYGDTPPEGVDPAAVGPADGEVVGDVVIDTSQWNDPAETPPTEEGSIVIRPSRPQPADPAAPPPPRAPESLPEEAPTEEAPAEAAPVEPAPGDLDWEGYEEAEDWGEPLPVEDPAPPPS